MDEQFADRIAKLAKLNDLEYSDLDDVVSAVTKAGACEFSADDRIVECLHIARSKEGALFNVPPPVPPDAPGAKLDPEFRLWLRGLLPTFDAMPAERRLDLLRQFQAEQRTSPTSAEQTRKESAARYGIDYRTKATALEKLALAHAERDGIASQARDKTSPTSRIQGTPERRLAYAHARSELTGLRANLRNLERSTGGSFNVTMGRDHAIDRIRDKIAGIERRFPELVS